MESPPAAEVLSKGWLKKGETHFKATATGVAQPFRDAMLSRAYPLV
jgi:hypothetical protein